MTGFDTSTPVDLHGWDLVLSLPVPAVNEALAAWMRRVPARFVYEEREGAQPFRLEGYFGPWSITGGSGQSLALTIPLAQGSLTVAPGGCGPLPPGTHDVAGCVVSIVARLRFRRPTERSGIELLFAFDETMEIGDDTLMASGSAHAPAGLSPLVAALLPEAVASCLAANAKAFHFAFAALTPTSRDLPLEETGTFAYTISGRMAGNRHLMIFYAASGGTPQAPEVSGIHGGTGGAVICAVSARLVLDHIVRPALLRALSATQDDLTVGPGLGPDLDDAAEAPFAIDPDNFRSRIKTGGISRIEALNSFPIRLVHGDSTRTYVLRAFAGELDGSAVRISYCLQRQRTVLFVTVNLAASGELRGRLDLQPTGIASRPAGLRFGALELQNETKDSAPDIAERIFGSELDDMRATIGSALAEALASLHLPLRITALAGSDFLAESAYLNGGLALSGRLAPAEGGVAHARSSKAMPESSAGTGSVASRIWSPRRG